MKNMLQNYPENPLQKIHEKKHEKKNLGKDEIILKKQNKIAASKAENKTEQLIYL